MRICLIGMPGSGKSLIGMKLSEILRMKFIETDRLVEERLNLDIPEIFKKFGESYFREVESEILKLAMEVDHSVLSTGGGLPCFSGNMNLIKEYSFSIYLELSEDQIIKRLNIEKERISRPHFKDMDDSEIKKAVSKMLNDRIEYYSQADLIVKADLAPERITRLILDYLQNLTS